MTWARSPGFRAPPQYAHSIWDQSAKSPGRRVERCFSAGARCRSGSLHIWISTLGLLYASHVLQAPGPRLATLPRPNHRERRRGGQALKALKAERPEGKGREGRKGSRAGPFGFFSPTAESFGVSAQIGCGVVRGNPEVRFHEGFTRVPPGFHQGSARVSPGFHQGPSRFCEGCGVVRALKRARHAVGDIT